MAAYPPSGCSGLTTPGTSAPSRSLIRNSYQSPGRIRVCGRIWWPIVHQILPGTQILPDLLRSRTWPTFAPARRPSRPVTDTSTHTKRGVRSRELRRRHIHEFAVACAHAMLPHAGLVRLRPQRARVTDTSDAEGPGPSALGLCRLMPPGQGASRRERVIGAGAGVSPSRAFPAGRAKERRPASRPPPIPCGPGKHRRDPTGWCRRPPWPARARSRPPGRARRPRGPTDRPRRSPLSWPALPAGTRPRR
jgi:hypothetical protein